MTQSSLATLLFDNGMIGVGATVTPLAGGVSCDTVLINDCGQQYVAKQALAKLRVKQEWLADVTRNEIEQAFLLYLDERLPGSVPHLIRSLPEQHLFLMEYLPGFNEWKTVLMAGESHSQVARAVGELLGNIHCVSWHCPVAERLFPTDANFHQLRLAPYFEALLPRHPALSSHISDLCQRLLTSRQCLVHGDFSPKNLLVREEQVVVIDGEVAWYGDPVFDLAFILCHLVLKSIHKNSPAYCDMARLVEQGYRDRQPVLLDQTHLVKTLLMLLLARVDGKSPAEYLNTEHREQIRGLVFNTLRHPPGSLEDFLQQVCIL